ncbi:TetR/AcrR family transcriptional regulator [Gryllotalpicola reticulitermitis]|uniref:TetR/AcrR family transcriptional regulator n=1 Tax=Gryllotalpicola reticulitermitis TaxID=1184153 RepID=A0ABV8Q6I5_9MICO
METRTRKRPALERVVRTADRLFYERGLHETGVDTIAAEADVSKATMYTYFPSKDDLVAEYLRGRSSAWRDVVAERFAAHEGDARSKALLVFDLLGEWFAAGGFNGCPFINAEAESDASSPAHAVNLEHRGWALGLFDGLLAEAGASPKRRDPAALALVMLYDGCMVGAHTRPDLAWAASARVAAAAIFDSAVG